MSLKVETRKSKHVIEIQSTFDVDDFQHSPKSKVKTTEDNSHQGQLVEGLHKPLDKKTNSNRIYVDENNVYHYVIPHCSHCGSTKVTKHDTNNTPIYLENGEKEYVEVKKYKCKKCGRGSQVEFKGEFKKFSGLPEDLKEKIPKLNSLHHISLRDMVKIIKIFTNIDVSHEYVRKAQLITDKLFWVSKDIDVLKYANYDVQWVPTDKGWEYLHVLVDYKTKKIVAVELTENEKIETTEAFFKKALRFKPEVIISDLKPGYHKLIQNKLKINHQQCLIHFKKALNKKIREELGKIKSRIKGKLQYDDPDISDETLKNEITKQMKPIEKEYWSYKEEIVKTFDQKTFDDAVEYVQGLKKKAKNYPKELYNYLHNDFFMNFRSFILYKHEDYKDKIPQNNNLAETKIGWCSNKSEKRQYRTGLAFFNHIILRIINWG